MQSKKNKISAPLFAELDTAGRSLGEQRRNAAWSAILMSAHSIARSVNILISLAIPQGCKVDMGRIIQAARQCDAIADLLLYTLPPPTNR